MTYKSALKYITEQIHGGKLDKNDCYREILVLAEGFGRPSMEVHLDLHYLYEHGTFRPKKSKERIMG
jgi:hypothetical protein